MKSLVPLADHPAGAQEAFLRLAAITRRWVSPPRPWSLPFWYSLIFFFGAAGIGRGFLAAMHLLDSGFVVVALYAGCMLLTQFRGAAIARNPRTSATIGSAGFMIAVFPAGSSAPIGLGALAVVVLLTGRKIKPPADEHANYTPAPPQRGLDGNPGRQLQHPVHARWQKPKALSHARSRAVGRQQLKMHRKARSWVTIWI